MGWFLRNGRRAGQAQSAKFCCCVCGWSLYFAPSVERAREQTVNSELAKQALAKVGNPNVLVNLVSRRVRQLNSPGGATSRPLISETAGLGAGDIALLEIIHDKMGWEMPEDNELIADAPRKRKKG